MACTRKQICGKDCSKSANSLEGLTTCRAALEVGTSPAWSLSLFGFFMFLRWFSGCQWEAPHSCNRLQDHWNLDTRHRAVPGGNGFLLAQLSWKMDMNMKKNMTHHGRTSGSRRHKKTPGEGHPLYRWQRFRPPVVSGIGEDHNEHATR